jgi:hypothetical protein
MGKANRHRAVLCGTGQKHNTSKTACTVKRSNLKPCSLAPKQHTVVQCKFAFKCTNASTQAGVSQAQAAKQLITRTLLCNRDCLLKQAATQADHRTNTQKRQCMARLDDGCTLTNTCKVACTWCRGLKPYVRYERATICSVQDVHTCTHAMKQYSAPDSHPAALQQQLRSANSSVRKASVAKASDRAHNTHWSDYMTATLGGVMPQLNWGCSQDGWTPEHRDIHTHDHNKGDLIVDKHLDKPPVSGLSLDL